MKRRTTIPFLGLAWSAIIGSAAAEVNNPNHDLIYVPVTQCRLVDTRQSTGGNLVADVAQDFFAYGNGAQISAQGGNPGGCADPKAPNGPEPAAVSVNITAVGNLASGKGNIRAYPAGTPATGSLVNFTTGLNQANTAIVPICRGACPGTKQFSLMSALADVPVAVDVLGYFYPRGTNIVAVATDGGDFTNPLDAIAFLRTVTPQPSATTPWVIQIEPGTYELGASKLVLDVPYVTVRGAGAEATILTGTGPGGPNAFLVSIPKRNVRLESLGIQSTGVRSISVSNEADPGNGVATVADVRASAPTDSALWVQSGEAEILRGRYSGASGGAVFRSAGIARTEVLVDGAEIIAVGGSRPVAVSVLGAGVSFRNATIYANGGDITRAMLVDENIAGTYGANVKISGSTLTGEGGAIVMKGTGIGSDVTVDGSALLGNIQYGSTSLRVGASQITGTVSGTTGTVKCVGAYDGAYDALNSSCQ